jgi:hypothetical protein
VEEIACGMDEPEGGRPKQVAFRFLGSVLGQEFGAEQVEFQRALRGRNLRGEARIALWLVGPQRGA